MKLIYVSALALPVVYTLPGSHNGEHDYDDFHSQPAHTPSVSKVKPTKKVHPCDKEMITFSDQTKCMTAMYKAVLPRGKNSHPVPRISRRQFLSPRDLVKMTIFVFFRRKISKFMLKITKFPVKNLTR